MRDRHNKLEQFPLCKIIKEKKSLGLHFPNQASIKFKVHDLTAFEPGATSTGCISKDVK